MEQNTESAKGLGVTGLLSVVIVVMMHDYAFVKTQGKVTVCQLYLCRPGAGGGEKNGVRGRARVFGF